MYSFATCWIIIVIKYDTWSILHKINFLSYYTAGRVNRDVTHNRQHYTTNSFLTCVALKPQTTFPPSRTIQNIYISTKIVICNDHYSVLSLCAIKFLKLNSRLYYVIFQNNLVWKFISSKQTKKFITFLYIQLSTAYNLTYYTINNTKTNNNLTRFSLLTWGIRWGVNNASTWDLARRLKSSTRPTYF